MSTNRRLKVPCMKTNSKYIKDRNLKPETPKLLEENIDGAIQDKGVGKGFLNRTPIAQG